MMRRYVRMAALAAAATLAFAAAPRAQATPEAALRSAIEREEAKGDVAGAIEQYRQLAGSRDRSVAARALLRLGDAYRRQGDGQARATYERLVNDFADRRDEQALARERLQALEPAALRPSQSARQVWAGDEVGAWQVSPDGRSVLYGIGSTGDLALRDLATKTTRRLTDSGGWVASGDYVDDAIFSPDGQRVAYSWFVERDRTVELRLMSLARAGTSTPQTLMRNELNGWVRPVGWTPDGRIVVVRTIERDAYQLGTLRLSDGQYQSLKSLDWRNPGRARLSPDGRYVAYVGQYPDNGSPRDILVLALDGSFESVALSGPADDFNPLWSPDGSHLVFMSSRSGSNALWTLPMRHGRPAGEPVRLRSGLGQISALDITRSGSLYYLVSGASNRNVYVAPLSNGEVTGAPVLLTDRFSDGNLGPAWSPDGETLAYYSMAGLPTLVMRSVNGGQERAIALPQGTVSPFFAGPKWFPDGRSVLILARQPQGSRTAFFKFDVATGATERLHVLTHNPSSFALSPDGGTIFWAVQITDDTTASRTPSGRLMRYEIATRQETELKRDEWFISLAISPDGRQLAYLKSIRDNNTEAPSAVEIMPAAGGAARQLLRDAIWYSGHRYNTLTWTPDGRNVLVVRDDGLLWRVPVDGSAPRRMGIASHPRDGGVPNAVPITMEGRMKSPAVHPDGSRIAFGVAKAGDRELWALDNFLPVPPERK